MYMYLDVKLKTGKGKNVLASDTRFEGLASLDPSTPT
jgi:hypothetical protein